MGSDFELIGNLTQIEIIAINLLIRELRRLKDESQASSRLKPMHMAELDIQFAVCIASEENEDLEVWKIYRVLPDSKAMEVGCLRVIDESGEDYLYPQSRFVIVALREEIREKLLSVVEK